MTGYGKSTAAAGPRQISVEVRSLNSKGLDLGVKMPAAYRSLEHEVRSVAGARISRGKADVHVTLEEGAGGEGARINAEVFGDYFRQIKAIANREKIALNGLVGDSANAAIMAAILRLPDVMTTCEGAEVPQEQAAALTSALTGALDALDAFRAQEGAILMADMLARVDGIEALMTAVEPYEAARVPAVRARILENVAAAGVTVDANRLEQELVFWVEKLDITEEKVRLAKHCDYFRATASSQEEGVGRKLGFIAQEMGREINTLGSKANDADIQRLVVQMKDELEKIKEQLLNIL